MGSPAGGGGVLTAPTSPFSVQPYPWPPANGTPPGTPGTAPSYTAPAAPASPYPGLPNYTPPTAPPYGGPAAAGPVGPPPIVVQPNPAWDPYATPGTQRPSILPQDPYLPCGPPCGPGSFATMQQFLQELRADNVWMPGRREDELGIDDLDLSATFALPFFEGSQPPLLITPGFTFHFWDGPVSQRGPGSQDLPPDTYDAYLDAAWNPQLTKFVGLELGGRIGVYSDFKSKVIEDSFRLQGHALGVLSLSEHIQVKAGVMYLDRNVIKVLPSGGIVWTPNSGVRYEILFPNPKLAWLLATYGNTEWWTYVRGEYGGGAWTIKRDSPFLPSSLEGLTDRIDYNDIRVGVGLEFDTPNSYKGLFEVGGAFDREVVYATSDTPPFRPSPTIYVRGSLAF